MSGSKTHNQSAMPELPAMIGQPLRDILRGVAVFADLTEETLEPAKRLLPDPVRSNFRTVLSSLEDMGARAVSPVVAHRDILAASDFIGTATATNPDALTIVLAYAWERSAAALTDRRFLFSEVVAGRSLAGITRAPDESPYLRAARIYTALLRARPIGVMPALDMPMRSEDETRISMIILSFLVWLVSERAASLPEEERLLDLAIALTMAKEGTIKPNLADTAALAAMLEDLARHL